MSIFYDTLEKFKDFSSMVNIKLQQFLPEFSLLKNVIASYDKTLADSLKINNKNYIEVKNKLELLKQKIEAEQSVIKILAPQLVEFENCYNKKYSELELQVISQKAFIRVKEDELKDFISIYELKMKEKKQLEKKMAFIKFDIEKLKNDIEARCQQYIETVNENNIEKLKALTMGVSSNFSENIPENVEIKSDYTGSEEYLNATRDYREAYKKLCAFMSGIIDATQQFLEWASIEMILPDLMEIQNKLKEKYNDLDQLDVQTDKIKDFEIMKENYRISLKSAEDKLENILGLAERDDELLRIKADIEEYLSLIHI